MKNSNLHFDDHSFCCKKTLNYIMYLLSVSDSCINYKVRGENLKALRDGGRNVFVVHSELGVRAGINVLTVVGSPPVRLSALAFVFSSQHALPVADRLICDLKDVGERSELFACSWCAARLKFSVLGALPVMYLTNAPQSSWLSLVVSPPSGSSSVKISRSRRQSLIIK